MLFYRSESPDHVGNYVSGGKSSDRIAHARRGKLQGPDERAPSPPVLGLGVRLTSSSGKTCFKKHIGIRGMENLGKIVRRRYKDKELN